MLDDATAVNGQRMSILCAILQYDPRSVEANSTSTSTMKTVFPVVFQVFLNPKPILLMLLTRHTH